MKFWDSTLQRLQKHIFYALGGVFALAMFAPSVSLGQFSEPESAFPYEIGGEEYTEVTDATTDIATDLIKEDTKTETSIFQRLMDYFRLSNTAYNPDGTTTSVATNYVKRILNILL